MHERPNDAAQPGGVTGLRARARALPRQAPAAIVVLMATIALTAVITPPLAAARQAQPMETYAPRQAGEPIMAIVSIKTQQVTLSGQGQELPRHLTEGAAAMPPKAATAAVRHRGRLRAISAA
jgi:hypothetical protein